MSEKRSCGDCTACCTALGVPELSKPATVRCPHVCESGCQRYRTRPKSCRKFKCLWLEGAFDEEHRPDKTGIVVGAAGPASLFARVVGQRPLTVFEAWEGAFESAAGRAFLDGLSATQLVIKIFGEKARSMLGPPKLLQEAIQFMQERRHKL